MTQNVSMNGIAFVTTAAVEPGTEILVHVYLSSAGEQVPGLALNGRGTVVRVQAGASASRLVAAELVFESEPEYSLALTSTLN